MSILAAAAVILLQAQPTSGLSDFREWGVFSLKSSPGRAAGRDVTVRLLVDERQGSAHWIAERTEREAQGPARRTWADSRTCPALAEIPASLAQIEPITVGKEIPIVEETPSGALVRPTADGPSYVIDAPAALQRDWPARVRLESGEGPVRIWVEAASVKLAGCWSDEAPQS